MCIIMVQPAHRDAHKNTLSRRYNNKNNNNNNNKNISNDASSVAYIRCEEIKSMADHYIYGPDLFAL